MCKSILKLSTIAFLVYQIEGLRLVGVAMQLVATLWLTHKMTQTTFLNRITLAPYISVLVDAVVLYLMCACTLISPAPVAFIYTIGILTMFKHVIHHGEISTEIRNAYLDF